LNINTTHHSLVDQPQATSYITVIIFCLNFTLGFV
jgi:hypothetical protein